MRFFGEYSYAKREYQQPGKGAHLVRGGFRAQAKRQRVLR
jgi:hypothetical protein